MAHLMRFYLTLWYKEGRVLFPLAFINLLFLLFFLTRNDWGWIMALPLLPILLQLFSVDFRRDTTMLLQLNGVKAIDQHYAKVFLLFPISLFLLGNSLIILTLYDKFIFESWWDGLIFLIYLFLGMGFFHRVRTSWQLSIIFLICSWVVFYVLQLFGDSLIFHFLSIPVLVFLNFLIYKNVVRSKF
jgi:hypothetical protein